MVELSWYQPQSSARTFLDDPTLAAAQPKALGRAHPFPVTALPSIKHLDAAYLPNLLTSHVNEPWELLVPGRAN